MRQKFITYFWFAPHVAKCVLEHTLLLNDVTKGTESALKPLPRPTGADYVVFWVSGRNFLPLCLAED